VQLTLDFICDPDCPEDDLLSALEWVPDNLYDFYSKLLQKILDDKSRVNRERGLSALALLITATLSRNTEFLGGTSLHFMMTAEGLEPQSTDSHGMLGKVLSACHHLVARNQPNSWTRHLQFEHVSVLEFLTLPVTSGALWQGTLQQFDERVRWRLVSGRFMTAVNRLQTLRDAPSDQATVKAYERQFLPGMEPLYWMSFCYSLRLGLLSVLPPHRRVGYDRSLEWNSRDCRVTMARSWIGDLCIFTRKLPAPWANPLIGHKLDYWYAPFYNDKKSLVSHTPLIARLDGVLILF
jgi:hypothetical protein